MNLTSSTAVVFALSLSLSVVGQAPHRLFDAPVLRTDSIDETELFGDVDNDGDVDLLVFASPSQNAIKSSFRVGFNDGTGRFTFGAPNAIPADSGTRIAYGDFNGDGFGDVIASSLTTAPSGAGLWLFRGAAGGTFSAPVHTSLPGNVLSLHTGDANADSIDDALAVHAGAGISITASWLWGVSGALQPLHSTVFPTLSFGAAATLDIDGDTDDDVAIVEVVGASHVLRLHRTTPTGLVLATSLPLATAFTHQIVPADLDGDGDTDILDWHTTAIAQVQMTTISNGGAAGFFVGPSSQLSGVSIGQVFAGDLDGDGDADLVARGVSSSTGGSYSVGIVRNDAGALVWSRLRSVPQSTLGVGAGLADLDADGALDFVDSRSLWFGSGEAATELTNYTVAAFDFDGDGDLDRVERPNLFRNDGSGTFVAQPVWPAAPAPNQSYSDPLVIADFDGNGLQEAIVPLFQSSFPTQVFVGMRRFEANADLQFVDLGPAAAGTARMSAGGLVVDLDGNGSLDVFDAQGAWLNSGAGFFTLSPLALGGFRPVAQGDVDGDGDMDFLAISAAGAPSTAMLMRTSFQGFTVVTLAPVGHNVIETQSAVLADLDGDGDLDVACRDRAGLNLLRTRVFSNTGGVFTFALDLPEAGTLLAADFDGDGRTDLLGQEATRLWLRPRLASGLAYGPAVFYALRASSAAADFDQDGDIDLLGSTVHRNVRIDGNEAGLRRQYGNGGPGSGGRRPLLSAIGPIRTAQPMTMRMRDAQGGTFAALFFSLGQANWPNYLPGLTGYLASIDAEFSFMLGGSVGQAGRGSLDVPLTLPPGTAGVTIYAQFVVLDAAAPSGLAHSNGVELRIGQ